ncbi:hypothetical protein J3L18_09875 [Mucilaginibacter gossypii]|uniref:hypothetical protein n=1 Tax=Mucilaginibacter gossypii TaxID=551996 RepID=UPI000DCD8F18|nr:MULTISPECIES: hypothetical protein [Mucilaginibacter]QTE39338.1 hypothetical protein J3L18_09875 [Mucilaginibacter gossypii]RAV51283.1 hypothetical protein DIU36_25785 [Mucilaginibacter rubeus]
MSQFPDPNETPTPEEDSGNIPDIWDIKTSGKGRVGRSDINLDEAMPCAEDSEPYLEGDIDTPGLWDDNDLSSSDQADYLGAE